MTMSASVSIAHEAESLSVGGYSHQQKCSRSRLIKWICDLGSKCIGSKRKRGKDSIAGKPRISFKEFINRGSSGQLIKNLLDSDTSSLDGGFAKKYIWI